MGRKVVITGLGLATPLGLEVEESLQKALDGTSGITGLAPCYDKSPIRAAGQVLSENWERICREFPAEAESEVERRTLFALWSAKKALADAGLDNAFGDRSRFGVVLASGLGINRLEDIHNWLDDNATFDTARFAREYVRVHRESIIRYNASRPAALISEKIAPEWDERGRYHRCARPTQALGTGFKRHRREKCGPVLPWGRFHDQSVG